MKPKQKKPSADTLAVWNSLKRAAKSARRLSIEMETPFYVMKNGRIIDLNGASAKKRKTA
jgi:hypothetical protein